MRSEFKVSEEIAENAALMFLNFKFWLGAKVLSDDVMKQVGNSEWVKGRKNLLDPKLISPIRSVQSEIRRKVEAVSLPFPKESVHLVPISLIARVYDILEDGIKKLDEEVEKLEAQYAVAREAAKESLGDLFDESDYPASLRNKFGVEWLYIELRAVGQLAISNPVLYLREKEKFEEMMGEARALAVASLRQEFGSIVSHCVDKLTPDKDGVPRIFRDSMVEKFRDFFATFGARNIFQDEQLANLIEEAKGMLDGVDANDIRGDAKLRRDVRQAMERVKGELDKGIMDQPLRKIRMPQKPQQEEREAA